MNHGFKINGNILEITLPDNIHIDKVIVNRQIFSQRMQVCKSCKYHGLEGHEEPCVSCEVGNSNYVPSVEQEERMEERTETHACDCISRQAAIDAFWKLDVELRPSAMDAVVDMLKSLPTAEPRKKGKWIYNSPVTMKCNQCGLVIKDWDWHRFKYCPNCCSDMRGERE